MDILTLKLNKVLVDHICCRCMHVYFNKRVKSQNKSQHRDRAYTEGIQCYKHCTAYCIYSI